MSRVVGGDPEGMRAAADVVDRAAAAVEAWYQPLFRLVEAGLFVQPTCWRLNEVALEWRECADLLRTCADRLVEASRCSDRTEGVVDFFGFGFVFDVVGDVVRGRYGDAVEGLVDGFNGAEMSAGALDALAGVGALVGLSARATSMASFVIPVAATAAGAYCRLPVGPSTVSPINAVEDSDPGYGQGANDAINNMGMANTCRGACSEQMPG